jgi:uncharacterized protein YjbJ (UPF0337 family)
MGSEDRTAGQVKQVRGKARDIVGAVRGDTGQQIRGKVEKTIGKVQSRTGRRH